MTTRDRSLPHVERGLRVIAIICAGALVSCGPLWPVQTRVPKNLILISLDTLRPDFLGCYGSEFATSPAIDQIAAEGLLFEDASATSPWTLPSHASLLTGLYPHNHGASHETSLRSDADHLAGLFQEHGFETHAIVNSLYVALLMDAFEDVKWLRERARQREPSAITQHAIGWLSTRPEPERPFFLFLHYYDAHSDYSARKIYEREFVAPYLGNIDGSTRQLLEQRRDGVEIDAAGVANLKQRYAANIRQLDDQVNELFEHLKRADLIRETLLVIVSDHGEEFLEHGGVLHGETQYEELVRIPMILRGPGVPAGTRTAVPASLIDVFPTVIGLFGFDVPSGLDGVDLRHFWNQESAAPNRLILFEADHESQKREGTKRAIRDTRFKLHYDLASKESALFDLREDPGETRDLSQDHPDVRSSLESSLLEFLELDSAYAPARPLSEQEAAHLRALGYGD